MAEMKWQPIETAPWQEVIWVKNSVMEDPVKATRGYMTEKGTHPDRGFFTTVYTPGENFTWPSGKLVIPDQWSPCEEAHPTQGDE